DVKVTSAAGYNQLATLISFSPLSNGSPIVAAYQIAPPAGGWGSGSSSYTVTLQGAQVGDVTGNFSAAGSAGTLSLTLAAAPGKPVLAAASDSGSSSSDGITSFNNGSPAKALQFSVASTLIGDTVIIFSDGIAIGSTVAVSTTTTVTTDGATKLADGPHS